MQERDQLKEQMQADHATNIQELTDVKQGLERELQTMTETCEKESEKIVHLSSAKAETDTNLASLEQENTDFKAMVDQMIA